MKKYFSCTICSKGFLNAYSTIYKNDPYSKIYIINGDDYDRAIFISHLTKSLDADDITVFNPFYDDSPNGIFIEALNTYVLSDDGYNRISPVLSGIWENYVSAAENKCYSANIIREVIYHKKKEDFYYRQACMLLKKASLIKKYIHKMLLNYINEDEIIKFVQKIWEGSTCCSSVNAKAEIRLLSSPTPLGIHTHYDTIFDICDSVYCIDDETGLTSSVIQGVLKGCAIQRRSAIQGSPAYFSKDFYQFLLFPEAKFGICTCDKTHKIPFQPTKRVSAEQFLTNCRVLRSREMSKLLSAEEQLLKKAVLYIYDGRNERFRYNELIREYASPEEARFNAEILLQKLLN